MNHPLVSVIVPVYNSVDGLERALSSVLSQTVRDLEVLVIDDGSDTGIDVAALLPADPRIRFLRHDRNAGYGGMTNTAVAHARGTWLTFVDEDDTVRPDYLAAHVRAGERAGADMVFGRIATVDTAGVRSSLAFRPGCEVSDGLTAIRLIVSGAIVANQHMLLRRTSLTAPAPVGNTYSDIVFLCRNLVDDAVVAYVDDGRYDYVIHPGSVSGALRESIWDLTLLPGELDAALVGQCPDDERAELVELAKVLVVSQLLNKAALEARDTPLRRDVTRWCRRAAGPRTLLTAVRAGDGKAALSLAAAVPGGRVHRTAHRLYARSKRMRA